MYKISSVFILCLVAFTGAADIKDCGSYARNVVVSINNCTHEMQDCDLQKGTVATITINFEVDQPITSIRAAVVGTLRVISMSVPFPITGADACTNPNSGITCPLSPGNHTYQYSLSVLRQYPQVKVDIKWMLINEFNQNIVCAIIPAKIVR